MILSEDQISYILNTYEGTLGRFNRTKEYFLPFLLNSDEPIIAAVVRGNDMVLGDDNKLYFPMTLDSEDESYVTDLILDSYSKFKGKGEFGHFIKDGRFYAGFSVPEDMATAFREGRYSDMYPAEEIKQVFTEELMWNMMETFHQRYGLGHAKNLYFSLKKAVYTITEDSEYKDMLDMKIQNLPEGQYDRPPIESDLITVPKEQGVPF